MTTTTLIKRLPIPDFAVAIRLLMPVIACLGFMLTAQFCWAFQESESLSELPERDVAEKVSSNFEVRLDVMQKLSITAKRDGFLETASLIPGTIIKKGDVLASLDTKRLELESRRLMADMTQAREELKVAELRHQELLAASSRTHIPQLEMAEAATNLVSRRAALEGKQAQWGVVDLEIKQSTIRAPFDGIVFKQFRHVGEAVNPQKPLAEIYRLDYLLGTVLLKQDRVAPQEFAEFSGEVLIDIPKVGKRSFEFSLPSTLPRVERDGRFLAVVRIKNRKSERADSWMLLPGMQGSLLTVLELAKGRE